MLLLEEQVHEEFLGSVDHDPRPHHENDEHTYCRIAVVVSVCFVRFRRQGQPGG